MDLEQQNRKAKAEEVEDKVQQGREDVEKGGAQGGAADRGEGGA